MYTYHLIHLVTRQRATHKASINMAIGAIRGGWIVIGRV